MFGRSCSACIRHTSRLCLWSLGAILWLAIDVLAQPTARDFNLAGLDPARALTQYVLDVWDVDDGLPQNSVTAVLRTQDGFLWVGTQEGLTRFDGRHFDLNNRRLPSSFVSALYERPDGTLWVGTYGGLVSYADGVFSEPIEGLPGRRISALVSDPGGALWVGTYDGGLGRIEDGEVHVFTATEGVPEDAVMDVVVSESGPIWIATQNSGLVRYEPVAGAEGTFTILTAADGLPDAALTGLALDPDGTLWISTERGLVRYDGDRFTTFSTSEGLPISDLRTVLADASGSVWLGGTEGGLVRFHQGRFSALTSEDGFPPGKVGTLHLDDEGNLWVGTDSGGLGRLRDGVLVPYSTPEGLADPYAWSVYESPSGELWIGTEGGLSHLHEGAFTHFTMEDGLPSDRVIAVRGTRDGTIWAGTHGDGLVRYAEGRFTTFTTDDGLPSLSIYALYEDRRGILWLGTSRGLVRYAEGRFTTFTTDDGLSNDLITVIAEDAEGCLLIGTYEGGLNTLCGESVTGQITTYDGLPSDLVLSLHVDGGGVIWAGLLGGLARIKDGDVHTFTTEDGLYSDKVLQLFEDGFGNFWMSSNRGLFRVPKQTLDAAANGEEVEIVSVAYGRTTGQHSFEFNGGVQPAGWQSADWTMWFPTTQGVVHVQPDGLPLQPLSAPRIEELRVDDEPIPLEGAISIPPGGRRLHFRFVAPSFVAPERIRYRYRLDGVDDDWVEAEDRREAFYTNIPPGSHTFQVQAIGAEGGISETAMLTFELAPHFHQTPWFLALCLFALTGVLYALYMLRVRYLVAQQRELERVVEARTEDLRGANQRLTETSELKSQLMHMVAHDLKNPLNGVHEIAKLLQTELDPDAPQQEFVLLVEEAAEQMLSLVLRFLDAEALDSDTLNIEWQPVDLVAAAHAAAARFQGAAERKDQRLIVDTAPVVPLANADPTWLKEVFDNLVSNAVKFTPSGKQIWIGVAPVEDKVRFAVRDEGPGLTPEDLDKLFGKFQRLSAQPTGGESSSGLGLSIVHRIVELLGGQVWAENAPEGGSIFLVELPVTADIQASITPTASLPSAAASDEVDPFDEFDLGGILIEG